MPVYVVFLQAARRNLKLVTVKQAPTKSVFKTQEVVFDIVEIFAQT